MYYGALYGSEWVYIVDPEKRWFPDVMEVGKTYTAQWTRQEYDSTGTYWGYGSDSVQITVTGPESVTVPAGTFTTYKLHIVDTWTNYLNESGVSTQDYWLAKGVGWVKMIRGGITYELESYTGPPPAPAMTVTTCGIKVTASWTSVANADGYVLFYAPFPYTGPDSIVSVEMAAQRSLSADLQDGAAFYVAIQAYNSFGNSGYSNIEYFIIGAPSVTTGSATSVTVISATLNGIVNPGGWDATYYFQYGPTTAYGSTTAITSVGSGCSDVSASASISHLRCDTTYHYRLVATNSEETSHGNDETFTTDTCPPAGSIPDTGQTECYNDSAKITCPQPGEDFYGQDANYTIYPPFYTKLDANGNALAASAVSWSMVKDNVTGLIWEVKTDDGSIHDKDNKYTWQGAQDTFVASLNSARFGGYTDWRLPTFKELAYIVNYGTYYPAIDSTYFPNTLSSYYWSSTPYALSTSVAWGINFLGGLGYQHYKYYSYDVRAVRGGQTKNSFVDNGNGTVTDTSTGLMWQKATAPGTYTWKEALSYCEGLTLAGFNNWRLPTIKELRSIVDYDRTGSAINTSYFPDTLSYNYWSSTTYSSTSEAWTIYFSYGNASYRNKSRSYYVHAVRGGQ